MPPSSYAYVGEIFIVPYNFVPTGASACDGSLLAISSNTALFSLLGTNFGGNGTSTFGLPDLRSRMVVGTGQGPALSNRALAQTGGAETVALITSQLPAHNHGLLGVGTEANAQTPSATALAMAKDNTYTTNPQNQGFVPLQAQSIGQTGGGQGHENMPPYLSLQFAISLFGVFPARS